MKQPVLFLSHGSPLTALGKDALSATWSALAARLDKPTAILVVSAHWTTHLPLVTGSAQPETLHDFGGFPRELYALRYPAPGAPLLAQAIRQRLADAGFATSIDPSRGLDHGAWVPLRTLFPVADVPVLQLSVQAAHGARHHYALGSALAALPSENVLIVASGHMTHNLRDYMQPAAVRPAPQTSDFRDWTHTRLVGGQGDEFKRLEELLDWPQSAPHALFAHPTPEHFLPLFVALGAAGEGHRTEWLGGGWIAESLAADNYRFAQLDSRAGH
jgi:4,5-DOPA dioxygenase extradiol